MNTIETIRNKMGITRPQMLRLLGDAPYSALTVMDERVDQSYIARAHAIQGEYERWVASILRQLKQFPSEVPLVPMQVARLLNISEFNLVQMRLRGLIKGVPISPRNWGYYPSAVKELVDLNADYFANQRGRNRGPLANPFLAWLETNSKIFAKTA